jgi:hypothetical protein
MINFREYLTEAAGKNLHLEHIEDEILNNGINGGRAAINFVQSLRDMLAGESKTPVNMTVKWDGAPAMFAGIDPSDGQFFVAKKGLFNKTPLLYKKESEIDITGDLGEKFKVALREFSKLGIKNVIQGDLLYTTPLESDIADHWTFQPNTIVYAVPKDSDVGKKIAKSKIGIVWHTTYTGDTLQEMTASFGMTQSLKIVPSVWHTDASYKDVSGTAKMTSAETTKVTNDLSEAGKKFRKINSGKIKEWIPLQNTLPASAQWKTYQNSLIRTQKPFRGGNYTVSEYFKFVHDAFDKITTTKKTQKSKDQWNLRKEQYYVELRKHTRNLVEVTEFMAHIVDAKIKILNKLNSIKQLGMSTFVKTKDGYKVTAPEGYVVADSSQSAVKLVDRLEFSFNNFTAMKAWDK